MCNHSQPCYSYTTASQPLQPVLKPPVPAFLAFSLAEVTSLWPMKVAYFSEAPIEKNSMVSFWTKKFLQVVLNLSLCLDFKLRGCSRLDLLILGLVICEIMSILQPIFVSLASESDDPDVTQIESLCMKCHKKGVTKLLLTKIPHYKEVIITSFECLDCGEKNTCIQSGSHHEFGLKYELKVETSEDLSRQIVKSDNGLLIIPFLEFSLLPGKGEITTVEGVISKAIDGLKQDQKARLVVNRELYKQIEQFIVKLENLLKISESFTIILDDPSGNSFIENLVAPMADPQLIVTQYKRTKSQNESIGIVDSNNSSDEGPSGEQFVNDKLSIKEEVLQFNTICDNCSRPCSTKMKVTEIPHFKEVVIMATECEFCGNRSTEVKSGSGIEKKGKKFTLFITTMEDLVRDVLKSETCSVSIPELELDVGAGVIVGKFTTVEGLLRDIQTDLEKNPFLLGDSAAEHTKKRIEDLVNDIQEVIYGSKSVHLELDDPAGNSFVQNLFIPEPDPYLRVAEYERTFDQNEELGLNDMVTENYVSEHEETDKANEATARFPI